VCEKFGRVIGGSVECVEDHSVVSLLFFAGKKLYVSMLSIQTNEAELYSRFAQFGPISEVFILREKDAVGTSKGCAFVRFLTREAAQAAILAFDKQVRDKVRPWRQCSDALRSLTLLLIYVRISFFAAIGSTDECPLRAYT
jgi:hypothetical protein